jgi:fatty-acyl-CoA synthase
MNFHDTRGDLVEALPYSVLAEEAREAAGRLLGLGLVPGDRIGVVAETDGDFVRAFMAGMLAGLVPCPMPLPTAFGARADYAEQLRRIARVADVSAVILAEPYRALVASALEDHRFRHLGPLDAIDAAPERLPPAPDPDALAYLQFSSGTTRAPRGIAVTHRALMANIDGMAAHALKVGPIDRGMSWLPFYHDMGLVGCLLLPVATQMSIDYLATRDFIRRPGLWLTMISRARATLSYSPSFGYQLAAQRARLSGPLDLSCWRIAGIGGDMIKTANLEQFARVYAAHGFRASSFLPSYGMAELALGFTFAPLDSGCRAETLDTAALEQGDARPVPFGTTGSRAFACCGHPLPGHEMQVRDDEGRVLAPRRVGRIFARGASVMEGYFRDAAATAAVLSPDGWLETGDKGYATEDGELVVTGRSKDLIIINGRNIWPQDIEWTLEHRLQGIREGSVAVFGMDSGSEAGAEEGLAVVLEHRGSDTSERERLRVEADAVVRTSFGLAPEILFSPPGMLPRTSSGKLSRAQAREMHRAGRFQR